MENGSPSESEIQPKKFSKELFAKCEVKINSEPIPLTRVAEVGLYNDMLNWINNHLGKAYKYNEGKGSITPTITNVLKPMADEMPIAAKTNVENSDNSAEIMRPDFLRTKINDIQKSLIEGLNRLKIPKENDAPGESVDEDDSVMLTDSDMLRSLSDIDKLDKISDRYIRNQKEIEVDFEDLGKVTCRMVEMVTKDENSEEPLNIYLGGIGTDPRSIAPALQEIAFQGEDVIGLGYPDSQTGTATDKFAEQVEESDGLEAHAEFYKKVILELKKKYPNRPIKLWGQSTGSLVMATMLNDPEISREVDGAVLIGSAGSSDVSDQGVQFALEAKEFPVRWKSLGYYNYVAGIDDRTGLPQDLSEVSDQKDRRGKIWIKVAKQTGRRQKVYDNMKVKEGGKIFVVTGSKDRVTRDYQRFTESTDNIIVLNNKDGMHQDTNTKPHIIFPRIFKAIYSVLMPRAAS